MTLQGTFHDGVIVLDQPAPLQEGDRVRVVVDDKTDAATLSVLLKFAGRVNDLPSDMAAQHDHYIHGTPKG